MKNFKYFVLLFAMMLIIPFAVRAEGEEEGENTEDNKAIVYFFRGEGCPHCQEAEEWFDSIKEEYGSKFKIVDYETWYNSDNAELMKKVAEVRGESETATGVPYIIIGDKSWVGFAESSMADEIKAQIDSVYDQPVEERYDVISLVDSGATPAAEEKSNGKDVVALLAILVVVGGVCFGIYKARQSTN